MQRKSKPTTKKEKATASNAGGQSSSDFLKADLSADQAKKVKGEYSDKTPFRYHVLKDVFDEDFLEEVKTELDDEEWYPKNNDLYTFAQTDDLKNTRQPHVAQMRDLIYSQKFRNFIQTVTGIKLNNKIDASAARYWKGSTLLCHDDELEGRRVAYIFYLVPKDWKKEDGGSLDLFDTDSAGQPRDIVRSLIPQWNSFAFFEVTPTSFHQVSEVLAADKERFSVSGWFHGEPIVRPPPYIESPPTQSIIADESDDVDLSKWINPTYLDAENHKQIASHFEKLSSIELQEFLLPEKYAQIEKELKNTKKLPWKMIGPANRRHYESIGRNESGAQKSLSAAKTLSQTVKLFHSPSFASLLTWLTKLEPLRCATELRRFTAGCYTLAQDLPQHDQEKEVALDLFFQICPPDWDEDVGGTTTYMSEDAELLCTVPQPNSLSLAFRAGGNIMRFVKYLRADVPGALVDISCVYWESEEKQSQCRKETEALIKEEKEAEERGEGEEENFSEHEEDAQDEEEAAQPKPQKGKIVREMGQDDGGGNSKQKKRKQNAKEAPPKKKESKSKPQQQKKRK